MLRALLLCTLFSISMVSSAQKLVQYDTMFVVESENEFEIGTHINSTGDYSVGLQIKSLYSGLNSYGEVEYGVRGSSLQAGVIGENRIDAPLITNFQSVKAGVRGIAYSSEGLGVYGENNASTGAPIGVGGFVQSAEGVAIQGLNFGFTGYSIAVKGTSHSPSARAIVGESLFTLGTGRGVHGTSHADMGVGVYGETTSTTGSNVGVKGLSISESGYGVHAENTIGVGLLAQSTDKAGLISVSTNGIGAEMESQNNYGVYAFSNKAAAIYGESESDIGIYISGNSAKDDVVLGGPLGKLSSDIKDVNSALLFTTQSNATIKLDEAKIHDATFVVLDGDGKEVLILEENGNLTITGTLSDGSNVYNKEEIVRINEHDILEKLLTLPISEWQYKGEDIRHIGPMAQDFYKAFGLGQGEASISTVDRDGVAFAAIKAQQGLIEKQRLEISKLNEKVEALTALILQSIEGDKSDERR